MVARGKIVFLFYALGIVLVFSIAGIYEEYGPAGEMPTLVFAIFAGFGMPGFGLAVCCITDGGVHAAHLTLLSVLTNIGLYLLIPYLFWKKDRQMIVATIVGLIVLPIGRFLAVSFPMPYDYYAWRLAHVIVSLLVLFISWRAIITWKSPRSVQTG